MTTTIGGLQEGSLCAQHCLNALLQGELFTPIDLAELAQTLDESEREHMAEAGHASREYQQFILQPSSNYDDSGFFSIQVLQQALCVWGLALEPFNSSRPECQLIRCDPRAGQAFVCNFREHWLTIRRIGDQWFNLNSLLTGPELLSDTHLSILLEQLQHEGYSIFVVLGDLPPCEAADMLRVTPAVQPVKPRLLGEKEERGERVGPKSGSSHAEDPELERALEESRRLDEDDDESLKRALQLSMIGFDYSAHPSHAQFESSPHTPVSHPPPPATNIDPDFDEMRRRRLILLDKTPPSGGGEALRPPAPQTAHSALSASPERDQGISSGGEAMTRPALSGSQETVRSREGREGETRERREGERGKETSTEQHQQHNPK